MFRGIYASLLLLLPHFPHSRLNVHVLFIMKSTKKKTKYIEIINVCKLLPK